MGKGLGVVAATVLCCASLPALAAGDQIVSVKGTNKVVALSPVTGATRVIFRIGRGYVADVAASQGGRQIVVATALPPRRVAGDGRRRVRPERIWVMAGDGGGAHVLRTFYGPPGELAGVESVDISRDGRRIAAATRDWIAVMHGNGSAARRLRITGFKPSIGGSYYSGGPTFTPDGRRLLGAFRTTGPQETRRRGIATVPVVGGRVHFIRSGPVESAAARGFSPAISEDGTWIAYLASVAKQLHGRVAQTPRHRIFLMRRDGTRLHRLRAHPSSEWSLSNLDFSPSGRSLVFGAVSRGPKDGFEWGVDPTAIGIVPKDGSRLRLLDREPLRGWTRSPVWVR